jgi:hypothetical protein
MANGAASSIPKSLPVEEGQALRALHRPPNLPDAIVHQALTATLTILLEALSSLASPPSVIRTPTPLEVLLRLLPHLPALEDLPWDL